jgi:hypothetical protein
MFYLETFKDNFRDFKMNFTVQVDIELTNEEISCFRTFLQKLNINFFLTRNYDHNLITEKTLSSLHIKGLLRIDSLGNVEPTALGYKILEQLDRDKKINDILNN